jgi:hypothetical protein
VAGEFASKEIFEQGDEQAHTKLPVLGE